MLRRTRTGETWRTSSAQQSCDCAAPPSSSPARLPLWPVLLSGLSLHVIILGHLLKRVHAAVVQSAALLDLDVSGPLAGQVDRIALDPSAVVIAVSHIDGRTGGQPRRQA